MKKSCKHITKEYRPLKIYLDNIEDIVALFQENGISYTISTDNFEYDSITELRLNSNEKQTKTLSIKTSNPHIVLEFEPHSARIFISEDTTFTLGLYHQIDFIIKSSQRLFSITYSYFFIYAIAPLVQMLAFTSLDNVLPVFIKYSFLAFWLVWFGRAFYITLFNHSNINLIYKSSISNFFTRKRDDLIIALISGFIGAILGVIGTILTKK
jgi:hypothetical protein